MSKGHFNHRVLAVVLLAGCGGEADLGDDDDYWSGPPHAAAASTTEPTLLYRGRRQVIAFTADERNLYAMLIDPAMSADDADREVELVACSVAGCASDVRTLFRRTIPTSLAFDSLSSSGDELFWVESDERQHSVWTCPISGCDGGARLVIESDQTIGLGLGIDSDFVHWISSASLLVRCPRSGCDAPEVLTEVEPYNASEGSSQVISTGEGQIYFRTSNYDSRIFRVARSGGEPELLLADVVSLSRFDVTADSLYFSTSILAGEIKTCPLSGCSEAAAVVASNQRWPSDVSADPEGLFWVTKERDTLNLMKLAPGKAEPALLFTGKMFEKPLIHAPLALYWASASPNYDLFAIHRLSK